MKRGKRYRVAAAKLEERAYPLDEACALVKELSNAQFDESVELAVRLGIDAKRSDQNIRGSVVMPSGTGKEVRLVAVAKDPAKVAEAREAGALLAGHSDVLDKIKGGWLEFDVMLATPDAMPDVAKLGKLLGPRGLMPSPRAGTVTDQISQTVEQFKKGRVEFRNDKTGNVHVRLGKAGFEPEALLENLLAFLDELFGLKPSGTKGAFVRSAYLSPAQGPSVQLSLPDMQSRMKERGVSV